MLQKTQPTLKKVQQRFEEWRHRRRKRARIPSALWEAAVSLSGQHSVHKIAKLLHLNHTALQERVVAHRQGEGNKPKEPAFIEVDMSSPFSALAECIIEMEKPDGARMKMIVKGNCPDIAGVSKAFWG